MQQVAGHGVERAERLVHQQDVGVLGEGPGERDPLAHAARQLVRALACRSRRGAPCRAAPRPASARSACGDAAQLERQLDVARDGEPREQRRLLEHQRGAAVARRRVPAVGWSRPATRLSSVHLPQPEAPTRQTNSPAATSSDDPVEGRHRARRPCRRPWRRCRRPRGQRSAASVRRSPPERAVVATCRPARSSQSLDLGLAARPAGAR